VGGHSSIRVFCRPEGASDNSQGRSPWYRIPFFRSPEGATHSTNAGRPFGAAARFAIPSQGFAALTPGYSRTPLRGDKRPPRSGGLLSGDRLAQVQERPADGGPRGQFRHVRVLGRRGEADLHQLARG